MAKDDIIFFRSTYFNSKAGEKIEPEWYYMIIPVNQIKKLTTEQYEAFLMHSYDKLFNNSNSIYKMKKDFENYYSELDKINFLG